MKKNNNIEINNKDLNKDKDKNQTNNFLLLGEFISEEDEKNYQIFIRKLIKFKETIIDFLIYDLTSFKESEICENKIKNTFFAKIAHEFKTPINSVLGLIKKVDDLLDEKSICLKKIRDTLNLAENLSDYTIFLIRDLIDYSYTSDNNFWKKKKIS